MVFAGSSQLRLKGTEPAGMILCGGRLQPQSTKWYEHNCRELIELIYPNDSTVTSPDFWNSLYCFETNTLLLEISIKPPSYLLTPTYRLLHAVWKLVQIVESLPTSRICSAIHIGLLLFPLTTVVSWQRSNCPIRALLGGIKIIFLATWKNSNKQKLQQTWIRSMQQQTLEVCLQK